MTEQSKIENPKSKIARIPPNVLNKGGQSDQMTEVRKNRSAVRDQRSAVINRRQK